MNVLFKTKDAILIYIRIVSSDKKLRKEASFQISKSFPYLHFQWNEATKTLTEHPIVFRPLVTSDSKPTPSQTPAFSMQCTHVYIWFLCRPFQMLLLSPLTDPASLSTLC